MLIVLIILNKTPNLPTLSWKKKGEPLLVIIIIIIMNSINGNKIIIPTKEKLKSKILFIHIRFFIALKAYPTKQIILYTIFSPSIFL